MGEGTHRGQRSGIDTKDWLDGFELEISAQGAIVCAPISYHAVVPL